MVGRRTGAASLGHIEWGFLMARGTIALDAETEQAAFNAVRELEPKVKPKTLQELVFEHRADINVALKNHCTYEEIADCLKQFRIEISAATLKRYHRSGTKAKAKKAVKEEGVKPSERLTRSKTEKSGSLADEFSSY